MSRTVVVAFDKFRGSATSAELTAAAAAAARKAGWTPIGVPLADGGEGSLDVLGGVNKRTTVPGPLGDPVEAGWRLDGRDAFIEMAAASGLVLAGGADGNEPMLADTTGTGRLIATAIELGARTVNVLVGGSATTDGGLGALQAMPPAARLRGIELVVGCDVETRFVDAARVFGQQKGATPAQVELLTRRLELLQDQYLERYGVDLADVPGAGAAGGLAGGLVAVGARLESGFEMLAERVALDEHLADADLVITGEGFLDQESFAGKVVGGVHRWAAEAGTPTVAIVGQADPEATPPDDLEVRSLTELHGLERSMEAAIELVGTEVEQVLAGRPHDDGRPA
ncbi:MAG: glycerate kinase [Actinomycetota bacterium]